jgi:hypothetical protein
MERIFLLSVTVVLGGLGIGSEELEISFKLSTGFFGFAIVVDVFLGVLRSFVDGLAGALESFVDGFASAYKCFVDGALTVAASGVSRERIFGVSFVRTPPASACFSVHHVSIRSAIG